MQPKILTAFLEFPSTAFSMSAAGLAALVISALAAKNDFAKAHGVVDKVVALSYLCFAIPLAIFGALHFADEKALLTLVPAYMPWRLFWVYFVGAALIAASLSIGMRMHVRWSGLLFAAMMFLFVAMLYFPAAIRTGERIPWTIVFRETSFGACGLVLVANAMDRGRNNGGLGRNLITVGRVLIAITAIFFGVQHFLHPLGLPGVPLVKEMPTWIPARPLVDYLTGAFLIVGGVCFLLARKIRIAASYLGAWIVFLVVVIYVPVMVGALADPSMRVQVEGINYFADTLLFAGVILSLARIDPSRRSDAGA